MFKGINWIAVIVATVVTWLLGYLCFGVVFADLYQKLSPPGTPAIGLNIESAKLLVPIFVSMVVLAWVLVKTASSSLSAALGATFIVALGFDTTVYAVSFLTGSAPLHLMIMFAAFDMVTYLIAAVILTVLKAKPASA
jgi:hypothetical protein